MPVLEAIVSLSFSLSLSLSLSIMLSCSVLHTSLLTHFLSCLCNVLQEKSSLERLAGGGSKREGKEVGKRREKERRRGAGKGVHADSGRKGTGKSTQRWVEGWAAWECLRIIGFSVLRLRTP
ncbi:hypothetical protein GOP47_0008931 [Adiantum capillus-veneris]|uniref:Uncharacterized protein n=1 Tax=Adiantum capillus-veneris TaxID=13818 RepID=A0A9D4UZT6_ADICA|nr:hypothetical protein GOP47_0008931 [Adiantum capillus-veneris]